MPTQYALNQKAIAAAIAPQLKALGYRKRGSSFNRGLPDDVVHVIGLQGGRFDTNHTFTVNFAVTVRRDDQPDFLTESSCRMRARIGDLLTPPTDLWMSLDDVPAAVATIEGLMPRMLAMLDAHRTVAQILARAEMPDRSKPPHWEDNPWYAMRLCLKLGDMRRAQMNLDRDLKQPMYPGKLLNKIAFAEQSGLTVPRALKSSRGKARNAAAYKAHDFYTYTPWTGPI